MAADDVTALADAAPAVRRVRGFVEWVGEGRPLTQTGRVRRADALALADLAGDVLDPRYPIHSSSELPRLSQLVAWTKGARLVRVQRGRLVPVGKHAALLERPGELVVRLLEALPPAAAEDADSVVMADCERTAEIVFGELVGGGGSMPTERACDLAWTSAISRYWFPHASEEQIGWERRRSDRDTRRLLALAAELGVVDVEGEQVALTALGERCVSAWLGLGTPDAPALTVAVTLRESSHPVIWRRLRVPADVRLDRFHQVLVAAMGWQDSHLHVFERCRARYGFPDPDLEIEDDRTVTLEQLLDGEGDRLEHEYDFGDGWCHDIVLEAVDRAGAENGPRCTAGAGRCPPEDVGGITGYEHLRSVLADPRHDEHADLLAWAGLDDAGDFDPDGFAIDDANQALAGMLAGRVI